MARSCDFVIFIVAAFTLKRRIEERRRDPHASWFRTVHNMYYVVYKYRGASVEGEAHRQKQQAA